MHIYIYIYIIQAHYVLCIACIVFMYYVYSQHLSRVVAFSNGRTGRTTDGRTDGRTDGSDGMTDGVTDERTDGRKDGRTL